MKTLLTIAWSRVVEIEFDPAKTHDQYYIDKIKNKAILDAANTISWKDGMVTDCDFEAFID